MTFQSLFGERLKTARKALGWNQAQAAEISGVSREHWGRCERGAAVLGGEVLAALAAHGFDVLYVLSGECSKPQIPTLSSDEQLLLDSYREAPPAVRKAALVALLSTDANAGAPRQQQIFHGGVSQVQKVDGNVDQRNVRFTLGKHKK